jgi:hypothetical protein
METREMKATTSESPAVAYFDFESSVAATVLGIERFDIPTFDHPILTPLTVSLREATVGLMVTSGAYYPDQPRMRHHNDLSYRPLPRERDLSEVLFAHRTPIRTFALAEPNVAYPRDKHDRPRTCGRNRPIR